MRAISGIACLIAGIGLITAAVLKREAFWPLAVSGLALTLCGAFQIFESLKGWCAFRAMGLKTPW